MHVEKYSLLCYLQDDYFSYIAQGVRIMRRTVLPAILLFLALTLGCGGGGSSEPVNSIKIENVDLASATLGASTTVTITVSYDLRTADSAVINYCYAEPFSDRWAGCPVPIADIPVSRGKETIPITSAATFTGTKYLHVFLVPSPNFDSAVGVVSDVQTITIPFP
jgi:hypothetical protein